LPAFSIACVDDDQVIWADGFGFQDAEQQIPATADTVYRVGSVSKLFTDIAVMQLVEQGKLDLDVPIQDFVPGLNPRDPYNNPLTSSRHARFPCILEGPRENAGIVTCCDTQWKRKILRYTNMNGGTSIIRIGSRTRSAT
jgi:hypothetical protein